ncbi:MAG TPA: hypothetical protein VF100_06585 [Thermoanaerobaculia bacterium]
MSAARWGLAGLLALVAAAPAAAQEPAPAATSCTTCHGDPDWFDEEGRAIVERVPGGAHGAVGLSCHDCHGGNPSLDVADDLDAAMDPGFAPNPYVGVPERVAIPDSCGRCHSDPVFMRRFDPDLRVDQVQEYRTSHHGEGLAAGDPKVATCVDCHGVHGILGPENSASPVHPTKVAETCRTCHADPEHMAGYQTSTGRPMPTDPYAAWSRSVHANALLQKGDLSAPTCNDCHGNHGATPPGVESVALVCGQCHGREAGLFRDSPKQPGFAEHNELVAGSEGCADCHGEPQSEVTRVAHFTECATCHDNHAIIRPRVTMLGPLPVVPCAFCHEPLGEAPVPEPVASTRRYQEAKEELVARAREAGLDGAELFDRLIAEARRLEEHTVPGEAEGERLLRPEFERLFDKLRLGETTFAYTGADGEEVRRRLTGCLDCHAAEPDLVDEPVGYATSVRMLAMLQELAAWTARAERIALQAHRGGVGTREAHAAIDAAVDAQIELQVLVHTFAVGEGTAFDAKYEEGIEHARQALAAGQDAADELRFRHRGLAMSLVVIVALLVALGLKIRQLSRADHVADVG